MRPFLPLFFTTAPHVMAIPACPIHQILPLQVLLFLVLPIQVLLLQVLPIKVLRLQVLLLQVLLLQTDG